VSFGYFLSGSAWREYILMILNGLCCFWKMSEVLLRVNTTLVSSFRVVTGMISFFSRLLEP
jgi:hypothetical protein